jgi:hypothetical protein
VTKHTPGPWDIENIRRDRASDITTMEVRGPGRPRGPSERPYRDVIAEVRTDWGTHDEVEANARLMAAAPELLGALAELVDVLKQGDTKDVFNRAMEAAHDAISKARGTVNDQPDN